MAVSEGTRKTNDAKRPSLEQYHHLAVGHSSTTSEGIQKLNGLKQHPLEVRTLSTHFVNHQAMNQSLTIPKDLQKTIGREKPLNDLTSKMPVDVIGASEHS